MPARALHDLMRAAMERAVDALADAERIEDIAPELMSDAGESWRFYELLGGSDSSDPEKRVREYLPFLARRQEPARLVRFVAGNRIYLFGLSWREDADADALMMSIAAPEQGRRAWLDDFEPVDLDWLGIEISQS